jgi:hypothetical protein
MKKKENEKEKNIKDYLCVHMCPCIYLMFLFVYEAAELVAAFCAA